VVVLPFNNQHITYSFNPTVRGHINVLFLIFRASVYQLISTLVSYTFNTQFRLGDWGGFSDKLFLPFFLLVPKAPEPQSRTKFCFRLSNRLSTGSHLLSAQEFQNLFYLVAFQLFLTQRLDRQKMKAGFLWNILFGVLSSSLANGSHLEGNEVNEGIKSSATRE
jgi:hypothetical protein